MAEKTGRRGPADSPQAAASYVRRGAAAVRAYGARGNQRVSAYAAEYRALANWVEKTRKLVSFSYIEQFRRVSEGAEHVVYHDAARDVAVKATHANRFGHSADGERLAATPLKYLRRLGWHNLLFGDDIQIDGIAYDGEQMEVVTTQPWIVTARDRSWPTREEIDAYLQRKGFGKASLSYEAPLYFNKSINVIVADAHDRNILRDEWGDLSPIDLVIGRPGQLLQQAIDEILPFSGRGRWPVS